MQLTRVAEGADGSQEAERLADLDSYDILDTPADSRYDTLTSLTAEHFNADAVTLSFADKTRVWTKSHWGQAVRELPRGNSIFEMVMADDGPVEVHNLRAHPDFQQHRLHLKQLGYVSFAAVPVRSAEGRVLGMLAVFFRVVPRKQFSLEQTRRLESFAGMVSTLLELDKLRNAVARTTAAAPAAIEVEELTPEWPTGEDLRRALDAGELVLHYQPEVDLVTRKIVGVEALLRWQHPSRGLIYPSAFIDKAEETGIILPIGDWVMAEACRQIQEWNRRDARNSSLRVFVNLSARQFSRAGLADHLESLLVQSGTQAHQLGLEMTESSLMTNMNATREVLHNLRALGVSLLMDDFGTGYSSLSHLHSFPFDVLKIDRSFVGRMTEGEQPLQIVRTIIELARVLNMGVVAEGIETVEQYGLLRQMGCRYGQGYLFARPMTAEAMTDLLRLPGRILQERETKASLALLRMA